MGLIFSCFTNARQWQWRRPDPVAVQRAALETLRATPLSIVVAVDYTASNSRNGARSFGGRALHTIALTENASNLYERVLRALEPLHAATADAETGARASIDAFGFGDVHTQDRDVFAFLPPGSAPAASVGAVVARYREITPEIVASGPTAYAPALRRAAALVGERERAHALVIVADGAPARWNATVEALCAASGAPLYVVCVGVGDAPFALAEALERAAASECVFANFSFLQFAPSDTETALGARIVERVAAQMRARAALPA
jgi:hypothetical protein